MTTLSTPTCSACARSNRTVPQPRRPHTTLAAPKSNRCAIGPVLRTLRTRLRDLLAPTALDDSTTRAPTDERNASGETELLLRFFHHSDGAGFIGPGAGAFLRTMLTEALTHEATGTQVITTKADLDRLLSPLSADAVTETHASRLHVRETLEDAIELLELKADELAMTGETNKPSAPIYVWFATPGPDADVVHETLRQWPTDNLTGLMLGLWPYGPTHMIDKTGPRPLPSQPISLLSPEQAITRLSDNAP